MKNKIFHTNLWENARLPTLQATTVLSLGVFICLENDIVFLHQLHFREAYELISQRCISLWLSDSAMRKFLAGSALCIVPLFGCMFKRTSHDVVNRSVVQMYPAVFIQKVGVDVNQLVAARPRQPGHRWSVDNSLYDIGLNLIKKWWNPQTSIVRICYDGQS